ncbi:Putative small GTP-binding protein [Septoria linicola]|uniref:Translation initiation factor IF-2, mitochondrial n=1 Tax=Septoria linicola TaxID=215465 RepID=A0A9Q9EQS8_9PEZI|nr:Putative small GTP-binding protein [Septoria linicola]
MSEQRERAQRISMRQQHETEQNQATQDRFWKEEEERNRSKRETGARRKADNDARAGARSARSTGQRSIVLGAASKDSEPVVGNSLGQAMFQRRPQRSQGRQNAAATQATDSATNSGRSAFRKVNLPGPETRNVDSPRIRGRGQQQSGNNDTTTTQSSGETRRGESGGNRLGTRSTGKAANVKVSNPFGSAAAANLNKDSSGAATSGWGAGSTQTAPLQYAENLQSKDVQRTGDEGGPNESIDNDYGFSTSRGGYSKSFKPTYSGQESIDEQVADPHLDNKPQRSEPTQEAQPASSQQEELQAQQSVYDQASKFFESRPSQSGTRKQGGANFGAPEKKSVHETSVGAAPGVLASRTSEVQTPDQLQASSTETGAPETYDHNSALEEAGYIESAASAPEPASEKSTSQDPTPSSTETGAPEAYDHSSSQTQNTGESPAISYTSEPPQTVANAGSFGYFSEEAEAEPAPKPQRQEPSSVEQRVQQLEQPSSRHLESELSGSSFGTFESDSAFTPETRHDDPPTQDQARPAEASPLAQMASQTQRAQRATAPPPPPVVPPPPAAAMPTGGQLAWQPIEGHAQGGQWIWQSSPSSAPAASNRESKRSTRGEKSSQTSNFIPPVQKPEPPSPSISDSGYRATPFKADEYKTESSFDEEKAASWQHLRKKSDASTAAAAAKAAAAPVAQPKPQVDFDDDTWVDRTFNDHIREREERLIAQKEREQQRLAQSLIRQRQHPVKQQDRQNDSPRRLYNEPAQADKHKKCARCGEVGHIARFCPKSSSPFTQQDSGGRNDNAGKGRQGQEQQARNPFGSRDSDKVRNPFDNRQSAGGQKSQRAWGADQVIPTEPTDTPTREPRFDTIRHFVPKQDLRDDGGERNPSRSFEPVGGRRAERSDNVKTGRADRDTGSTPSRRFDRFEGDADVNEHGPATETRASRDKAVRKSRWADADEDVEGKGKGAGRKAQRAGRREYDEDEDDDAEARDKFRARKAARQAEKEAKEDKRRKSARKEREVKKAEDATPISIPEFVSVQQLSQLLGVRYEQFIDRLEELGYDDVFPGMTLNSETSGMIAMEYNFDPSIDTGAREEEERDLKPRPEVEDKEFLPTRPPVVTIMGHVDHGKTTILDYLRKSSVAAGEAGGITQHIGAFSVPMASSGKLITFLDTPGHAAFLAMRQRGANVTDIVILVVAADDSVKPQTLEAIKHAKAAGVPMIVAINKVDKEEADIQRVKQDLARHGVEIEDFGGETQIVPVSGKTGKGMDELEETVVALSEILDHRAETDGAVEAWVLEATTKERGRVATVLVRRGTLKPGAVIVAGKTWARVRSLRNEGGRVLQEVGPGMPVEVDGWRDQPMAGDEVLQAPTEQKATSVVEFRQEREEREKAVADMEAINEARRTASERQQKEREAAQALKQAQRTANAEGGTADVVTTSKPDDLDAPQQEQTGQMDVPFIIKADVSGSAEAVSAYIMSVSNPLITPSILHSQVGPVHESDIELANAAGGHIIAFNLPPDPQMQGKAESQGVKILENNIIYRVLDDVKAVLEDKLPPVISQRVLGEAEVGAAFEISVGGRKKLKIAGCKVRNGMIGKGARVRITRGSEKVYDGLITSLKNVKKDVTEMRKGTECGMGFQDWEGFEVGDQVQTYEEISEKRKL